MVVSATENSNIFSFTRLLESGSELSSESALNEYNIPQLGRFGSFCNPEENGHPALSCENRDYIGGPAAVMNTPNPFLSEHSVTPFTPREKPSHINFGTASSLHDGPIYNGNDIWNEGNGISSSTDDPTVTHSLHSGIVNTEKGQMDSARLGNSINPTTELASSSHAFRMEDFYVDYLAYQSGGSPSLVESTGQVSNQENVCTSGCFPSGFEKLPALIPEWASSHEKEDDTIMHIEKFLRNTH
ncbi:hypothetical protein PCANC_02637 [Puccinia coronata f. sp. avenae]|uniref:Uncharacterized protein n=1 Tax=Puccinia coronata f. sp. avenae TaxID=200324 RepID=A0A2N5W5J5_9BASI|nr:hypothetical protein PCANC_02637 [Puccinia coronata f. sp. avenae]